MECTELHGASATLVGKDCCPGEGRGAGKKSTSEDEADVRLTSC